MKTLSQKLIDTLKKLMPKGTIVKLISMEGEDSVNPGTLGSVMFVDDIGQIHVEWNNGSKLALVYGVDKFTKVE